MGTGIKSQVGDQGSQNLHHMKKITKDLLNVIK